MSKEVVENIFRKRYDTKQKEWGETTDILDTRFKIDLDTKELIAKFRLNNTVTPVLSIPVAYDSSRNKFTLIDTPTVETSRLQAYYYTSTPSETTPDYYSLRIDNAHRLYVTDDQLLSKIDTPISQLRNSLYASYISSDSYWDIIDATTYTVTSTTWATIKTYTFPTRLWSVKTYSYYIIAGILGSVDTSGQTLYVRLRSFRTNVTSDTQTISSTSDTWVYPSMTNTGALNESERIYIDAYVTGGTGYIKNISIFLIPLETPYVLRGTGSGFQAIPVYADSNNAMRVSDYYMYNPGNAETFTVTPLGANTTYYSPARDYLYSRLGVFNVMGYADQPTVSNGVYIQLSHDGTNWDYQGATASLNSAGAVSLSQVVTARYVRAVWVNGSTAQNTFRFGGRYAVAGSENPTVSLAQPIEIEPVCSVCGKDLTDTSDFFVENGKVYCPKCYANKRWGEVKDKSLWIKSLKAWHKNASEQEKERAKYHSPDNFLEEVSKNDNIQ